MPPKVAPNSRTRAAITLAKQRQAQLRPATPDPSDADIPKGLYASPKSFEIVNAVEESLGGREELINQLLLSPELTPNLQRLLAVVMDEQYDDKPLAWICAKAYITPGEVFAAFRDSVVALANIHAMRRVAEKLPEIATEIVTSALDHQKSCSRCRGTGQAPKLSKGKLTTDTCPTCFGEGTILIDADPDQQQIALQLVGLLQKGGGGSQISVGVNTTNQTANITLPEASSAGLAQLQQAVSGLLFSRGVVRNPASIEISPAASSMLDSTVIDVTPPSAPVPSVPVESVDGIP